MNSLSKTVTRQHRGCDLNPGPSVPESSTQVVLACYECWLSGRLTWLVYIIGAVIGGRVSFASTDEHDEMDGELVCRSATSLYHIP